MPRSNNEAIRELKELSRRAGLSAPRIAKYLAVNPLWVQRRFNGTTKFSIDDYNLIRDAISEMSQAK